MEPKRIREIVVKKFGDMLRLAREDRGWSQQQAVHHLRGSYRLEMNRSSLAQWEAGTVAGPDAGVLWALANSYEQSIEQWCHSLVLERTGKAIEPASQVRGGSEKTEPALRVSTHLQTSQPSGGLPVTDAHLVLMDTWWRELDLADRERIYDFARTVRDERLVKRRASGDPND